MLLKFLSLLTGFHTPAHFKSYKPPMVGDNVKAFRSFLDRMGLLGPVATLLPSPHAKGEA